MEAHVVGNGIAALLVIGFAAGRIPELKMNRVMLKNCAVVGVNWGGYSAKQPERMRDVYRGLFELLAKGAVRPVIYGRYALEQVPEALERVMAETDGRGADVFRRRLPCGDGTL